MSFEVRRKPGARVRRLTPLLPAALALVVVLFMGADAAVADIYRCRITGREWYVSEVPRGHRKHCRLYMKTADGKKSARDDDRSSGSAKKKRRHYDVHPHTPRKAKKAELPSDRLWRLVLEAAERYHLPPAFVLAVIKVESNFNPRAVSRVGARGLMQLMPTTASGLGVTDSFDPRQNVMGGCKYLRMLANRFDGDMARTIAGYHAGGGAVAKKQGVPYAATEQYVRWVLDRYYEYKEILGSDRM